MGATLTATATDGDITGAQTFMDNNAAGVTGVTWRWYRGGAEIADAQGNTYILQVADAGQHIRAVVYYIVTGNIDQEMAEVTTGYPVLATRIVANQLEFDPAAVSRAISEGSEGRNVGAPVTATGNHGTVRYTLAPNEGDDTRFEIDEETGQITTSVALDYEGGSPATPEAAGSCAGASGGAPERECTVTVIATDSTGNMTSAVDTNLNATVTITITDVNEEPYFINGSQTVSVPENSTALFGDTWAEDYSRRSCGRCGWRHL